VLKILAVSSTVQSAGGAEEKTKPGRDGTTTLKDTVFPVALTEGGLMVRLPEEILGKILCKYSNRFNLN
jgi:hypothetical protein